MRISVTKTDDFKLISRDPRIAELKHVQMEKFRRHAQLASIADVSKFLAGPMFAIGASAIIAGSLGLGIGLLAVAAVALSTAVTASYQANRTWVDGQFNNYEISAQSTAHHMVEEMKANQLEVKDHDTPQRSDGKSWQEYVAARAEQVKDQQEPSRV